ncbi:MAG: hypothetical protein KDE00_11965 [Rhodobacteraceae bacterium]|nr:hypothetical protein [Paracoccaceae bacterium]
MRRGQSRDTYVIAVRDYVVLADLCDTIRDLDPRAVVLSTADPGEVPNLVQQEAHLSAVLIEAGPSEVCGTLLNMAVRARGGRLILLGDDAEEAWEAARLVSAPWPTLLRPFTADIVHSLVFSRPAPGTLSPDAR